LTFVSLYSLISLTTSRAKRFASSCAFWFSGESGAAGAAAGGAAWRAGAGGGAAAAAAAWRACATAAGLNMIVDELSSGDVPGEAGAGVGGAGGGAAAGRAAGTPARSRTSSPPERMAAARSVLVPDDVVRPTAAFGATDRTSTILPEKRTRSSMRSATWSSTCGPFVSQYRMAASLSRRTSGTASAPLARPPRRASASRVPGDWSRETRIASRWLCTGRRIVSAVSGTLICLTASAGPSKPRAYQPIADGPFTMNIAARGTN
jgi:hypothetical protein